MKKKQIAQFNKMLQALRKISKEYMTPDQLRKASYGLDYEESLEMAYENIRDEARLGCKGVRVLDMTTSEGSEG